MNCPICNGETIVLAKDGAERRRKCTGGCGHRFSTIEKLKEEEQRQAEVIRDAKALAEKLVA